MSKNSGLEAITLMHSGPLKGTLIAFAENLTDKNGNLQGWLIGGPRPGSIAVKRLEGFDITDAAELPDGGLVILERRFRYSEGIKMRIRRVAAAELKPGAVATGEVLLEATDNLNIDNMEAIGVHRRAVRRNHPHGDVRRQFQPAAADPDHAVHAARREIRRRRRAQLMPVMPGLVPGIHDFNRASKTRGWPGQARP